MSKKERSVSVETETEEVVDSCSNDILHTESCIDPEWEPKRWYTGLSLRIILAGCSVFAILLLALLTSPKEFPKSTLVKIEEGWSVTDAVRYAKERGVVRSELLLRIIITFADEGRGVIAGNYFFEEPISVIDVAKRFTQGDYGLDPVRVFVQEGSTTFEIAKLFSGDEFTEFDPIHFLELAEGKEGYLFPDTYYFLPNVEESEVISAMEENFYGRIASIQELIDAFDRPLHDIIIMASIIEKEAWKSDDRRMISSVLWNRIDIGMPLQVDAVFPYIIGRNTYELSLKDLEVDSPYNTYRYNGLPIGPISNPSLDSIEAAVTPPESDYLYYLADRVGNTYFSVTFDEHVEKKWLYVN
ncbi:MAG: endolytic transglycosylase MltG [Candidatus Paceibacterota bacterium]